MAKKHKKSRKSEKKESEGNDGQGPSGTSGSVEDPIIAELTRHLCDTREAAKYFQTNLISAIGCVTHSINCCGRGRESKEMRCFLMLENRMSQITIFLDVYETYIQRIFTENLFDIEHGKIVILGIQAAMDRGVKLIDASKQVVSQINASMQKKDDGHEQSTSKKG